MKIHSGPREIIPAGQETKTDAENPKINSAVNFDIGKDTGVNPKKDTGVRFDIHMLRIKTSRTGEVIHRFGPIILL